MLDVHCPVCGSTGGARIHEVLEAHSIYECLSCLVQYASPFVAAGGGHYESSYITKKYWWSEGRELERVRVSPRYRTFFRHVKAASDPKLLDLGCGMGAFMKIARQYSFRPCGMDGSAEAVSRAAALGMGEVRSGSLYNVPDDWGGFYAVTSFEVLEHLDRPSEFIQNAYGLLRSGGFLCVSVPDRGRFELSLAGRRDSGDLPPNHLSRWSSVSLLRFLRRWDWEELRVFHTALEVGALWRALGIRLRGFRRDGSEREAAVPAPRPSPAISVHRDREFESRRVMHSLRVLGDHLLWGTSPLTIALGAYGHSLVALAKKP